MEIPQAISLTKKILSKAGIQTNEPLPSSRVINCDVKQLIKNSFTKKPGDEVNDSWIKFADDQKTKDFLKEYVDDLIRLENTYRVVEIKSDATPSKSDTLPSIPPRNYRMSEIDRNSKSF